MVTGEADEEPDDEGLIVSWASLEKRKAQLEEIVKKRIPENTKEIALARSYGDLRENFEFKAAKDMQAVLMRQKEDLETEISLARGTDFTGVDASTVNIGTVVSLKDGDGQRETYSILGAWDTDLDKGIISYLSSTGKALLGCRPGDEVELPSEKSKSGAQTVVVESVEPYVKGK